MSTWKTAALIGALTAAAGAGAALAPVAHGQATRVVTPGGVQIINGLSGGRLGVSIRDVTAEDAKSGQTAGVLVTEVTEDSAAGQAGVRSGDVVVEFDGERVRSSRQFTRLVQESVPGRAVPMVVMREGQRQALTVTPEEGGAFRRLGDELYGLSDSLRGLRVTPPRPPAPPAPPAPPNVREFPDLEAFVWRSGNVLGVTANSLTPQLAEYFGVKEGVLVTSVRDESVASRAGLKAGDVVTAVNGTGVSTPDQLRRETQRLGTGEEFTLNVVRDRKAMTLKGKAEERRDFRRSIRTVV